MIDFAQANADQGPLLSLLQDINEPTETIAGKVQELLEQGADVHKVEPVDLRTALHFAVQRGLRDVTGILLWNGADPNAKNLQRQDPFEYSRQHYLAARFTDYPLHGRIGQCRYNVKFAMYGVDTTPGGRAERLKLCNFLDPHTDRREKRAVEVKNTSQVTSNISHRQDPSTSTQDPAIPDIPRAHRQPNFLAPRTLPEADAHSNMDSGYSETHTPNPNYDNASPATLHLWNPSFPATVNGLTDAGSWQDPPIQDPNVGHTSLASASGVHITSQLQRNLQASWPSSQFGPAQPVHEHRQNSPPLPFEMQQRSQDFGNNITHRHSNIIFPATFQPLFHPQQDMFTDTTAHLQYQQPPVLPPQPSHDNTFLNSPPFQQTQPYPNDSTNIRQLSGENQNRPLWITCEHGQPLNCAASFCTSCRVLPHDFERIVWDRFISITPLVDV